jgi:hypothetical protein
LDEEEAGQDFRSVVIGGRICIGCGRIQAIMDGLVSGMPCFNEET